MATNMAAHENTVPVRTTASKIVGKIAYNPLTGKYDKVCGVRFKAFNRRRTYHFELLNPDMSTYQLHGKAWSATFAVASS